MRNKNTTIPVTIALVLSTLSMLTPGAAAHHDGDQIDDDTEVTLCTLFILGALGLCDEGDFDAGSPNPDELIPDDPTNPGDLPVEPPGGVPNPNDLLPGDDPANVVLDTPLADVLGPICGALGESAPPECVFQHLTLGQMLCFLRAAAPGGGIVIVCDAAGHVAAHCAGTDPMAIAGYVIGDSDCDGHANDAEAAYGCDAMDPSSYPVGPGECSNGGGNEVAVVGCGETDPGFLLGNILTDPDCDGHSTDAEITYGCDPTSAAEFPGIAGGCSFGEAPEAPDPSDVPTDPGELPADPGELPADPGELPADPGELPADPGELPVDPGELPVP